MPKTFLGGVHPPYFKELARKSPIRPLPAPPEVIIPLIQHTGSPCLPAVKAGDNVRVGTLIGKSEKFISANIHSSLSGKVKAIKKADHPVIGKCDSVFIESNEKDEIEKPVWAYAGDIERLTPDDLRNIIREAGIVGLGGAAFPTHVKLSPPKEKPIDVFILNGAECEPYLTCDERVMIERPREVLEGAFLIMKVIGAEKGFIAIEDNNPEAIDAVRSALRALRTKSSSISIIILSTKYPQGGEKQLIKAILKRDVPAGGLPFDVGCIVDNVQTALAVYEAVYKAKPLYERVITVTGEAVKEPSNLLVRIGTPISYILEKCGGLRKPLAKVIMGGPMMGIAQYTVDVPVIKGTSGIVCLSEDEIYEPEEEACIRCGKCIEVCPMGLVPATIMHLVKNERFKEAGALGVMHCFECGACTYECPAKIPLLDYMKFGKSKL